MSADHMSLALSTENSQPDGGARRRRRGDHKKIASTSTLLYTLADIGGSMSWKNTPVGSKTSPNSVKDGQLKLIISEMLFLTRYHEYVGRPHTFIVYAGSGRGYHLPILISAMPRSITWILFDPSGHCPELYLLPNVIINNSVMDPLVVRKLCEEMLAGGSRPLTAGTPGDLLDEQVESVPHSTDRNDIHANIILISDIRKDNSHESVVSDHKTQDLWLKILAPAISYLKWRLPYENTKGERVLFEYFQSTGGLSSIFLQVFNGPLSGECRHVVIGNNYSLVSLDSVSQIEIENKLYYYNREVKTDPYMTRYAERVVADFNRTHGTNMRVEHIRKKIREHIIADTASKSEKPYTDSR